MGLDRRRGLVHMNEQTGQWQTDSIFRCQCFYINVLLHNLWNILIHRNGHLYRLQKKIRDWKVNIIKS